MLKVRPAETKQIIMVMISGVEGGIQGVIPSITSWLIHLVGLGSERQKGI